MQVNWWAQQLQKAYVAAKHSSDNRFKNLPDAWQPLRKWEAIAVSLLGMRVQIPPTECIKILFTSSDNKRGPAPFELPMLLARPLVKAEFAAMNLDHDECSEMRETGLNPENLQDCTLYRTKSTLKYWLTYAFRASESVDINSSEFVDKVALNILRIPAWAAYAFNPGNVDIAKEFQTDAEKYYDEHPDVGDALIKLGYPETIIFPGGHPYGR